MDRSSVSPVSLDDVIARGTSVHWDEAVAIIEEMCHVLMATSGDDAHVPALEDVLIDAHGALSLRRTRGERSPSAAGRALHMLLANAEVPAPLRLFVTQSIAPDTYGSLREFAKGLSYFGKPDRTQMIQDVHARCAGQMPFDSDARPVPPLPVAETEFPEENPQASAPVKRRRVVRWALVGASLCLAGGAGWVAMSGGSRQALEGNASRLYSQAAAALADVGKQVRETLAPTPAPPAEAAAPASTSPRRRAATASSALEAAEKPIAARRVTTASPQVLQLAVAMPTVAVPEASDVYAKQAPDEGDAVVYSVADRGVEPPVLLYPHVRPAAAVAGAPGGINTMAVIVAADGTVEHVQIVDGPMRMPDMMLLSGAKTWRFAPATKDGEPVRYRTVMSWSGLP